MVWNKHDYDDIPGTYVFDGKRAHPAYHLNKLLYSFNKEKNREAFEQDRGAYCNKMGVTGAYKECVIKDDFLGMIRLGANIYYMAKMAVPRGVSIQDAGAQFQGITTEKFILNLLKKGDNLEEKIAQRGDYWNG